MSRLRQTMVAIWLVLASTAIGFAQETPQQQAETANAQGRTFYDARQFKPALEQFKSAFQLHPSPRYLFNAAKACVRLDDLEGAIYFYERYLAVNPTAGDRDEVTAEAAELRRKLLDEGRREIRLEASPEGAVLVPPKGHSAELVDAPASFFVRSGTTVVRVTAEGHVEQLVTLDGDPSDPATQTVKVTLQKPLVVIDEPDDHSQPDIVQPHKPFPWQWVLLGVGGAGAVVGGVGGYLWYDGWAGMNDANDQGGPDYASNYNSAGDRYVTGQWLVAAGAAVAVGGALGYFLWPESEGSPAPSVSLFPGKDGGFMLGLGAFF